MKFNLKMLLVLLALHVGSAASWYAFGREQGKRYTARLPGVLRDNRAVTGLIEVVISIVIGTIAIVNVGIPVVQDAINTTTGTVRTVLNNSPILMAVMPLALIGGSLAIFFGVRQ